MAQKHLKDLQQSSHKFLTHVIYCSYFFHSLGAACSLVIQWNHSNYRTES